MSEMLIKPYVVSKRWSRSLLIAHDFDYTVLHVTSSLESVFCRIDMDNYIRWSKIEWGVNHKKLREVENRFILHIGRLAVLKNFTHTNTYANKNRPHYWGRFTLVVFSEPVEGFEPPTRLRILITNQAESTAIRHWQSGQIRWSDDLFPNCDAKVVVSNVKCKSQLLNLVFQ